MKPLISSTFSALLIGSFVVAVPLDTPGYTVNCIDEAAITDPSCWNSLKVADYLASWSRTTPNCTDINRSDVNCCMNNESWSTCFVRLGTGSAGYSCDSMNDPMNMNLCGGSTPKAGDKILLNIRPQVNYVLRAIWAVHSLFTSYNKGEYPSERS